MMKMWFTNWKLNQNLSGTLLISYVQKHMGQCSGHGREGCCQFCTYLSGECCSRTKRKCEGKCFNRSKWVSTTPNLLQDCKVEKDTIQVAFDCILPLLPFSFPAPLSLFHCRQTHNRLPSRSLHTSPPPPHTHTHTHTHTLNIVLQKPANWSTLY